MQKLVKKMQSILVNQSFEQDKSCEDSCEENCEQKQSFECNLRKSLIKHFPFGR